MKLNYRKLGLMMMTEAASMEDNRLSNDFARVGEDLTSIGAPFNKIKKFNQLSNEQLKIVRDAYLYFKDKGLEKEFTNEKE